MRATLAFNRLGLSILDISKIVMYEYRDHYAKPKYGDDAKL